MASPSARSTPAPDLDHDEGEAGALVLLLLDSRAPAGAHNHSAGMESAVNAGLVQSLADVEAFCAARLRTSGLLAAQVAATACAITAPVPLSEHFPAEWADVAAHSTRNRPLNRGGAVDWALLDAEFDARTPSAAVRAASHAMGRGLLRLARSVLPSFVPPPSTHHPVVLGAAVAVAGGSPRLAARAAALGAISVPASAAVRLLGLDPFAVHGMLARLAATIDASHDLGAAPTAWTAAAVPALDLLADHHLTTEVRLFAS